MQIYRETPQRKGDIVQVDGKIYEVQSCVDLNWITKGEQEGHLLQLLEIKYITKEKHW